MCRAKAFKAKEEEKHFERGFTMRQTGIRDIDKYQTIPACFAGAAQGG
jgi:hypothetical protein